MSEEATTPPVDSTSAVSLWTPVLYLSVLVAALVVFSNQHRKRKREKLASTKQFYEYNFARDVYEQLKSTDKKVPRKLSVSALLAWGVEDFTRVIKFKENEPIMANLLQGGIIGEDFFERFTGSLKLNERELEDIAREAQLIDYPWPKAIESIREITQQFAMRKRLSQIDVLKQEYRDLLGGNEPKALDGMLLHAE